MKINKLTIKNIFSIENETIDFTAEPLASTDVFLITGPTGAGKTTIFDAICLALYSQTPRMTNLKMQGAFAEGNKNIQVDDCRQYLRKGSGEGWVELTFVGNDGQTYMARWGAHRAGNKPDGALQKKEWTLKTPEGVLDKDKEVIPAIMKAVGLDFNQFCRTTMLAQGDFTEFLDSEDNKKAEILEKITGLTEYSVISSRLYAETKKREDDYNNLQDEIKETKTLGEDELKKLVAEQDALKVEDQQVEGEKSKLEESIAWLNNLAVANKDLVDRKLDFQEASAKLVTPDFLAEKKFLTDWQTSIEARNALQVSNEAAIQIADQKRALQSQKEETLNLLAGKKWLEEQIKTLDNEIVALELKTKPFEAKANAYSNVQTIASALNTYKSNMVEVGGNRMKIQTEEDWLKTKLQPDFEERKVAFNQKESAYKKAEGELKQMEQEVEALKLNDLRKQVSTLNDRLHAIKEAGEKLADYSQKRIAFGVQTEALEERKAKIDSDKRTAKTTGEALDLVKTALELAKQTYDKLTDSDHKWAKAMRMQFKVGCQCPVCRQEVKSLPKEEDIDNEVKAAYEKYKNLETKYNDEDSKFKTLVANIKAADATFNSEKQKLDNDTSLIDAGNRLAVLCAKLGLPYSADNLQQLKVDLDTANTSTEHQKELLDKAISEGEAYENQVKVKQREVDSLRSGKENAERAVGEAEKAISDVNTKIERYTAAIETANSNIKRAKSAIMPWVEGLSWNINWIDQPEEFSDLITVEAGQYNGWLAKQDEDKRVRENLTREGAGVSLIVEDIMVLEPEWRTLAAAFPVEMKDINQKASDVKGKVSTAEGLIKSSAERIETCKQLLSAFYTANPAMNEDRLKELDLCSLEEKMRRDSMVQGIIADATTKEGLFKAAENNLNDLKNNPKALPEDTVEALTAQKTLKETRIKEISGRLSEIQLLLDQDKAVQDRLGVSKQRLKVLKADYEKWDALNQLIGSADGKKFRLIAQSYVLANVVGAANTYMQMLTNRYKLDVEPGTLIINVEDSYQGYAQRATSTISGGEKFIVSLALALGLSSMANGLSVDMLFIDEGFGTLSGKELNNAINTLRSLHRNNKQVAIISHVESLEENIDVQIQLEKNETTASSTIKIVSHCA